MRYCSQGSQCSLSVTSSKWLFQTGLGGETCHTERHGVTCAAVTSGFKNRYTAAVLSPFFFFCNLSLFYSVFLLSGCPLFPISSHLYFVESFSVFSSFSWLSFSSSNNPLPFVLSPFPLSVLLSPFHSLHPIIFFFLDHNGGKHSYKDHRGSISIFYFFDKQVDFAPD